MQQLGYTHRASLKHPRLGLLGLLGSLASSAVVAKSTGVPSKWTSRSCAVGPRVGLLGPRLCLLSHGAVRTTTCRGGLLHPSSLCRLFYSGSVSEKTSETSSSCGSSRDFFFLRLELRQKQCSRVCCLWRICTASLLPLVPWPRPGDLGPA